MLLWKLVFYPKSGEKNSPVDRMNERDCSQKERASINAKLIQMQSMRKVDWPYNWAKPIEELLELKQGDFRVFHQLVEDTIVVCHVCRKVSNKAKKQEIEIARTNLNDYKNGEL
jgi:phage-related protein